VTETRAEYWDGVAGEFDGEADHGLRDPGVRAAWGERLRAWLPTTADVLDLGCGTGSVSVLLAEQGHRVTGVDFAPAMVEQARAKAVRHGVDVTFRVGDAADPGGEPASYDVVLTRHVLWALPDRPAAVARWAELLRPDGGFVLIEGTWSTGAGIPSSAVTALLEPYVESAEVVRLTDPLLWGKPVTDDRYTVITEGFIGRL
jgi:2-polyprenyl-3-methyl-5-hydroxy-6-metoxy-1,4-benzoquinol methylase